MADENKCFQPPPSLRQRRQINGDGFPRQADTIARYATASRIEIVQEFRDKGVSGAPAMEDALDRPGLTDLFVALKANGVRLVLVENHTRIARDLMVSEIILSEFRKLGVKVVSADGDVDLTLGNDDPTGKLVRQILEAVSEWEKFLIVQKLRASRLRIRRSGQRCEGRKPYGATPEQQTVVEKMRAWRMEKKSFVEIAAALNAENIPTKHRNRNQVAPHSSPAHPAAARVTLIPSEGVTLGAVSIPSALSTF